MKQGLRARLDRLIHSDAPMSKGKRIALVVFLLWFPTAPFLSHLHKAFHPERPHGDWYSIYSAAEYTLRTGELEVPETPEVVTTNRYPPIARPLIMIFALPPKSAAAVASFVLFAGLYLWCILRVSGLFLAPARGGGLPAFFIAVALAGPYIWADLTVGNLTSILLASVTGAYFLSRAGRPIGAGMVLSIGIILKIIPALCLLHFLVRRQWRVVIGSAVGVIGLGVLPTLVLFGPRKLADYSAYWYRTQYSQYTPMRTIESGIECSYQNQAVVRVLVRLLSRTNAGRSGDPFYVTVAEPPRVAIKVLYAAVMAASALALAWTVWRLRAESGFGAPASYALCVGSMLWFSPWLASYYFPLAVWPVLALTGLWLGAPHAASIAHSSGAGRAVAPALAIWVASMPALGSYYLRALGVHTLASGFVLVILAVVSLSWAGRHLKGTSERAARPAGL